MPTKVVNIRMEEDLLKYLQDRADKEHRTLSNMIISILLTEMENDDVYYQRQVEQLEHDMLYEPTFNPEDGSM